jgi:LacI family transcriptional regulator
MPSKVRLADIARASEVSPSTVSLVLRNRPGIPEETRRRVLDAAAALGYARMPALAGGPGDAGGDGNSSLHMVGLLVKADAGQAPATNPFYAHVLAGIEAACRAHHANLLYATLPVDAANRPTAAPRLLATDAVDGLLVVGALVDPPLYRLLGDGRIPLVLVDAYTAGLPDATRPDMAWTPEPNPASGDFAGAFDAVLTDNFGGAVAAVRYLLALGHRYIGMVGGGDGAYPSLRARRQGYRHALRSAGVAVEYCAGGGGGNELATELAAAAAARTLLQENPQISALFACNDAAALAAARAAAELGRVIPQDLALIGFDDIDLAAHVAPPLTTMHVDKLAMGRHAVELLAARIAYPAAAPATVLLHSHLVVRGTTGAHGASHQLAPSTGS